MTKERRIPSSRLGRFSQLGRLAGGMVGGMVTEGARQLARGNRPAIGDMLLTPANARRLADRLSEMRGAAMKMGQLLSMDSGQILPPQLGDILTRLREDAHRMPLGQVAQVLDASLGKEWQAAFRRFDFAYRPGAQRLTAGCRREPQLLRGTARGGRGNLRVSARAVTREDHQH